MTDPDTNNLAFCSAGEIAALIREGSLSSRRYAEVLIDRIEALNRPLNLVVTKAFGRALREADEADRAARRGEFFGPLHGVAMTIKDSFQTEGIRTTSGAQQYAEFIPDQDAVPVARLRAAGAIILGKTNLPVLAGDIQSYNPIFGRSNNPWNMDHTVGGSSGGAAGALAAGFTPLELGSDMGGSIRGPASCCGVMGHKPSFGIVPIIGQIPGPPGTLTQMDMAVAGPLARAVDDLELALDVMAGPGCWEENGWTLSLPGARHQSLADYRIAVWLDEDSAPLDAGVRQLLGRAAEQLADGGARVSYSARPEVGFEPAVEIFNQLMGAALSSAFAAEQIEALAERAAKAGPGKALAARNASMRHRDWLAANERRLQMRKSWDDFFSRWDAVLMPVLPTAAIPHDLSEPWNRRRIQINGEERSYMEQFSWVGLPGVAGLPSTVVPVGLTAEGLPVGVQIVGPFLEDRTCLQLARHLSDITGGFRMPTGI